MDDLESLNAQNAGQDIDAYRQQEQDRRDLENYRARDKAEQDRLREQEQHERAMEQQQQQMMQPMKRTISEGRTRFITILISSFRTRQCRRT